MEILRELPPDLVRILEQKLGLDSQERSIQRVSKPRLETRVQSRPAVRPLPKPDLLQRLEERHGWFACYQSFNHGRRV